MTRASKDFAAYLEERIEYDPNGGCWLWTRSLNTAGYGKATAPDDGAQRFAHRLSYRHFYGQDPGALHVCHRCDIRVCVNPAHLFLGTAKDNCVDMARKGRATSMLTPEMVQALRGLMALGIRDGDLAKRTGLQKAHIRSIRLGKTWAWLPDEAEAA